MFTSLPKKEKKVQNVPNPEGLKALLSEAMGKKALVTWNEAYQAAGFEGSFRNSACTALTTQALALVPNGDALIISQKTGYGAKVAAKHLATLTELEYPAEFIVEIAELSK